MYWIVYVHGLCIWAGDGYAYKYIPYALAII
jgi:hypothetical protein